MRVYLNAYVKFYEVSAHLQRRHSNALMTAADYKLKLTFLIAICESSTIQTLQYLFFKAWRQLIGLNIGDGGFLLFWILNTDFLTIARPYIIQFCFSNSLNVKKCPARAK